MANGQLQHNLADPALRPKLVQEMTANLKRRGGAETLLMVSSTDKAIVGKNLAQIAAERKESAVDAAIEIVRNGDSGVASFNMKDADIDAFMVEPWVMTCSDGSAGHPRKYGTFPRKFREYVFDKHVISLEFAVHSSTQLTAQTLGLKDRGLLKPGYFADVLVLDPRTYRDRATYLQPEVLATGVRFLAVNGKLAVDEGALTTARAGRVVTH